MFLIVLACRHRSSRPVRPAPVARSSRLRGRGGFVVTGGCAGGHGRGRGRRTTARRRLAADRGPAQLGPRPVGPDRHLRARRARAAGARRARGRGGARRGRRDDPGRAAAIRWPSRASSASPAAPGSARFWSLTLVPAAGTWSITGAAFVGSGGGSLRWCSGCAVRGGLDSDRLVLIGVGVSAAADGADHRRDRADRPVERRQGADLAVRLHLRADAAAGRAGGDDAAAGGARCSGVRAARWTCSPSTTTPPRVVGVRLDRARPLLLGLACLLTATAVSAVGVIAFVGLVAPHAARALVGARHARVLPVAALLGALLVSVADTLGRTVIAPRPLLGGPAHGAGRDAVLRLAALAVPLGGLAGTRGRAPLVHTRGTSCTRHVMCTGRLRCARPARMCTAAAHAGDPLTEPLALARGRPDPGAIPAVRRRAARPGPGRPRGARLRRAPRPHAAPGSGVHGRGLPGRRARPSPIRRTAPRAAGGGRPWCSSGCCWPWRATSFGTPCCSCWARGCSRLMTGWFRRLRALTSDVSNPDIETPATVVKTDAEWRAS